MLSRFFIDFHIHTALSPCADNMMTPVNIVHAALEKELHMIAITDHNSAENVEAVLEAAAGTGLYVIPGMEVQTREEVHLVCLFPDIDRIMAWQELIYRVLPLEKNKESFFGEQWICDAKGMLARKNERLLMSSVLMTVEETAETAKQMGGICYPAHIDRPNYSIISNLGFIPHDSGFTACELSPWISAEVALIKYPYLKKYALIGSSDAHQIEEINWARSEVHVNEPTFDEIKMALANIGDRKVVTV